MLYLDILITWKKCGIIYQNSIVNTRETSNTGRHRLYRQTSSNTNIQSREGNNLDRMLKSLCNYLIEKEVIEQ